MNRERLINFHTSVTKKQSHDYELIAMCYHEAGHALCGLHNFMKVYNVNVMTPKDKTGNTEYILFDPEDVSDKVLAKILLIFEIQATYAGLVAEKNYYKDICGSENFPMHLRIGSSGDINTASKLISKFNLVEPGTARFLFKKQIQSDTKDILIEHWESIKLIAHALYRKKKLNFDELKYLLTRKSENKDFWKDRFKKINVIHSEKSIPTEETVKSLILEDSLIII